MRAVGKKKDPEQRINVIPCVVFSFVELCILQKTAVARKAIFILWKPSPGHEYSSGLAPWIVLAIGAAVGAVAGDARAGICGREPGRNNEADGLIGAKGRFGHIGVGALTIRTGKRNRMGVGVLARASRQPSALAQRRMEP